MPRPRILNDEKVLPLFKNGWTDGRVADEFGVKRQAAQQIRKKLEAEGRLSPAIKRHRKLRVKLVKPEGDGEIQSLLKGITSEQIVELFIRLANEAHDGRYWKNVAAARANDIANLQSELHGVEKQLEVETKAAKVKREQELRARVALQQGAFEPQLTSGGGKPSKLTAGFLDDYMPLDGLYLTYHIDSLTMKFTPSGDIIPDVFSLPFIGDIILKNGGAP